MCDFPHCATASVNGYSIGLFSVEYCEAHRSHFEHQRAEYFATTSLRALRAANRRGGR